MKELKILRATENEGEAPNEQALKSQYLQGLGSITFALVPLRRIVDQLLQLGLTRKELIQWGVEAGYKKPYVRTLLSKLLIESGSRQRRKGAGPKIRQEALLIEAHVRQQYGSLTVKLLRAALRVAKANDAALQECAPQPAALSRN